MKRIVIVSIILLLAAAALPGIFISPGTAADEHAEMQKLSFDARPDGDTGLKVLTKDGIVSMTMHDYLVGVVASEMPAKFLPEALKAQAVAARTYAMYGVLIGKKHADADVCTDPACCQAWYSDEQLRKNWGDDYGTKLKKITDAVDATDGEYLVSGGEPILAAFHSSSGGKTENSADAWASAKSYLTSVSSPETEKDVPNFISTVTSAPLDFRDTVLSGHPEADFTGRTEKWLGAVEKDGSGRVKSVTAGGVKLTGSEMRALFGLRSAEFTIKYDGSAFVFTVTGSGHGVGMSQYGANVMASSGSSYAEILSHYYPGTQLRKASET